MQNDENFWWEIMIEGENEDILSLVDMSGSIGCSFDNDTRARAYYISSEPLEHWLKILSSFENIKITGHGKIENRAWHTEWKDAFPPLDVGENFVVLAPWHKGSEPAKKTPLYIYPATAFGTGYHESTQIALTLLEKYKLKIKNNPVADIGTGSGVLFIAAMKLGASQIFARDIDPTVLSEVRNNIAENSLDENKVELAVGDLLKNFDKRVNVLTANILFEPLCTMLPDVKKILESEGIAIFAGLLVRERENFLEAARENGLELADEISKNEWWGCAMKCR